MSDIIQWAEGCKCTEAAGLGRAVEGSLSVTTARQAHLLARLSWLALSRHHCYHIPCVSPGLARSAHKMWRVVAGGGVAYIHTDSPFLRACNAEGLFLFLLLKELLNHLNTGGPRTIKCQSEVGPEYHRIGSRRFPENRKLFIAFFSRCAAGNARTSKGRKCLQ